MADGRRAAPRGASGGSEIWTCIVPVGNLVLTKAVGREFKVERVTLVHRDRLPYVREQHGLGVRVSELKKKRGLNRFFEDADAFAVVRATGTLEEIQRQCLQTVREELNLLSVSELGYSRRGTVKSVVPKGEEVHSYVSSLSVRARDSTPFNPSMVTSPQDVVVMGGIWKRFQEQVLFMNLCKILQRQTKVKDSWRDDLRRAALLIGESVTANDLLKSFIWNMAALETLLTKQDQQSREKTQDVLERRSEALLGWVLWGEVQDDAGRKREVYLWEAENYKGQIQAIYNKRNSFLHGGKRDRITEQDLAFTDLLLLNILANLVRFPKLFPSKDKVIEFSKNLEAERTLKMKPRVRPNGLKFFKIMTIRS